MQEDFAAVQRIDTAPPAVVGKASASTAPSSAPRTFAAPSKLEPFLLLAKSARGARAASLIDQVTASSGVFVFAELLEVKSVAELQENEQHRSRWLLLHIFAYGTLKDYRNNASSLPSLSPAQLTKLRQLTLLALASKTRALPYSVILPALELTSPRELEDLIIECIYSDLLKARINQKKQVLEVDAVVGRDVKVGADEGVSAEQGVTDIEALMGALGAWHKNVGETVEQLDYFIAQLRKKEQNSASTSQAQSDRVNQVLAEIQRTSGARDGNTRGNNGFSNDMGMFGSSSGGMGGSRSSKDIAAEAMGGGDDVMEVDAKGSKRSPAKSNRKRSRA